MSWNMLRARLSGEGMFDFDAFLQYLMLHRILRFSVWSNN